ncbi:MAG TPA: UDP-glucose/GDP-mannose dehydrogenase family protein [Microthrixaceae bacterium]|nr:UDP-glucose/GDP-mannose dehydrogenase family protein [Microthrixaceae bacterium]
MASVAIIGAGYVGLTTGVCFGALGHKVVVADIDPDRVDLLQSGVCPIFEDGLERLMRDATGDGNLRFVLGAENAVADADFVYLCVPTPQDACGAADLSYIESAARQVSPHLKSGAVVVNKSTVPVGSADLVGSWIGRDDVAVVSNPEFLREGSAVHDFQYPDRIVIGAHDRETALRVASLYVGITAPVIVTDVASAELIKYASNAFLAAKLSFVNEIATLCEHVGADAKHVILGMGSDSRIGSNFLSPGPGWGGSCFPKDTRALLHISSEVGHEFGLLRSAIEANERHLDRVIEKLRNTLVGELKDKKVTVLGLTFKAGTDDLRESPALRVTDYLVAAGTDVTAHDPAVSAKLSPAMLERLNDIHLCDDPHDACKGADVVVIMTEWDTYRDLDLDEVRDVMDGDTIIDTRNLLERHRVTQHGLNYVGTGRHGLLR